MGGGLFTVLLGTINPLAIAFNQPYFLGIQVNNDPELQPRMPLTSTDYSLSAEQTVGMGNVIPSQGSVGLGTINPNPQHQLHVVGLARFDLPTGRIAISTPVAGLALLCSLKPDIAEILSLIIQIQPADIKADFEYQGSPLLHLLLLPRNYHHRGGLSRRWHGLPGSKIVR